MGFYYYYLPLPLAFALIALLGYLVGRMDRSRKNGRAQPAIDFPQDQAAKLDLERLANTIRKNLPDGFQDSANPAGGKSV
jgi:hypothetical protein